jgi:hypothetical protein
LLKFSKTVRVGAVALIIGAAGLSMNAGASAESTPTAEQLAPVDIVAVSGLLDDVVVAEIETAIDRSTTNGAQAIVLQVNWGSCIWIVGANADSGRCDSDGTWRTHWS